MTRENETHNPASDAGRFSYEGLDRVIHEKARLGILASLAVHEDGLVFNDLKQLCSLTDGNLSRHLRVLSDAGLVKTRKTHRGPRAQTTCRLTSNGRLRFVEYIDVLESVISDAHSDAKAEKRRMGKYIVGLSRT
jgi:DNA-binding HxlR family transcriptional regulator